MTNHLNARVFLLDLDGTLVDSTAAVNRCWTRLCERLDIDPELVRGRYHGMTVATALRRLDPGLDEDRIREASDLMLAWESDDTDGVVALPGARQFVASLPEQAWAIVTSCSRELARARLEAAEIPEPAVLVTAEDTASGKPDPAPYLLGAQRCGVSPGECLVIEDAPAGVTSGRAAGCSVLGVTTTTPTLGVPAISDLSALTVEPGDDGWCQVTWSSSPE